MTFPSHWHPVVEVTILGRFGIEDRESRKVVLGTHTGTHTDAPLHFIPHGMTIDEVPLDTYIGPATLLDLSGCGALHEITVEELKAKLPGGKVPERIMLRTDWSERFGDMSYYTQYPFLSEDAARWLVEQKLRLLVLDTPSPDNPAHCRGTSKDSPNHKMLLGNGVFMVEYACNLKQLSRQEVEVIVLPLKLRGCDGSPARCVAIER